MNQNRWKLMILLAGASLLFEASALAQSALTVGNVQMPLASPQEADQFFATRVVPPSSVSTVAPAALSAQSPQSVNVDTILGHELPADAISPTGLPRADFAVAKPDRRERNAKVGVSMVGRRPTDTTVIQQQSPVIGNP